MILALFDEPDFSTSSCSISSDPVCAYNREGDEGAWVCRTYYDPWTFNHEEALTLCIDPDEGYDTDECGCCESSCPTLADCVCDCITFDGTTGYLVAKTEGDGTHERCVNPENALPMIANEHYSCVQTCGGE
jgi:hypothetical protein